MRDSGAGAVVDGHLGIVVALRERPSSSSVELQSRLGAREGEIADIVVNLVPEHAMVIAEIAGRCCSTWAANSGEAKAPISVCGRFLIASPMRSAATLASFRSSILPILLGAMKAAAAISTQISSRPSQTQFLLSDAMRTSGSSVCLSGSSVYE